jgi:dihydrofolate synthase / folylpolyglutamate synthase
VDYERTLAYLYTQLPLFSRIGKAAYKADLSNTHALMDMLDHPERGLKCIHVAGTNGKGSTCHMLASVLQEAGYRTGLHTSPHLKDFRERIRINGEMIPKSAVVEFVERYKERFTPIAPSFFEWSVALTFHWFREQAVDIAVLETGLGGRLDSTNVVDPEVSVITNIGWDHADLLGNTLEAIAREKAGIIKPGVPVVVGEADEAVAAIFEERARNVGAPIHFVDHDAASPLELDLPGPHQQRNARTAITALHVLQERGGAVTDATIERGLARTTVNTGFAGRWQTIGEHPLTIVDVGHNEDGLRIVRDMLTRTPHEHLHIVLGTVNDKDIGRMLAQLPTHATYWFCKADIPRGLEVGELQARASAVGLKGLAFPSVREALNAARTAASDGDLVLVTGSVFVVAEAL